MADNNHERDERLLNESANRGSIGAYGDREKHLRRLRRGEATGNAHTTDQNHVHVEGDGAPYPKRNLNRTLPTRRSPRKPGTTQAQGRTQQQQQQQETGTEDETNAEDAVPPAAKKQRGKNVRSRLSYIRDMRGPFPNPCSERVCNKYAFFHYEQAPLQGSFPTYAEVEANQDTVRLMVGDGLILKRGLVETHYTIYDFRRNAIIVSWRSADPPLTPEDLSGATMYRSQRSADVPRKHIKGIQNIWVRRDPTRTKQRCVASTGYSEALVIKIVGHGSKEDYSWMLLSHLPERVQFSTDERTADADAEPIEGPMHCFVCGEQLKRPSFFRGWTAITCTAEDRRRFAQIQKHCVEAHAGEVHWALCVKENTFVGGEAFGIRDRAQWAMQQAAVAHPLPLQAVTQWLVHGNRGPFSQHVAFSFGYARAMNAVNNNFTKLGCFQDKKKYDFAAFTASVDRWLEVIFNAYERFDVKYFVRTVEADPAGVADTTRTVRYWNLWQLFMIRGLYMQPNAAPLAAVGDIPNTPPAVLALTR